MKSFTVTIDRSLVDRYTEFYFKQHPRAKKPPIKRPIHPSINDWMILTRQAMNSLKQKWKDFTIWLVGEWGYTNAQIQKCTVVADTYFPTRIRHDVDNTTIKFILDGMVEAGMLVDDSSEYVTELTLHCYTDKENPRTEITFCLYE